MVQNRVMQTLQKLTRNLRLLITQAGLNRIPLSIISTRKKGNFSIQTIRPLQHPGYQS